MDAKHVIIYVEIDVGKPIVHVAFSMFILIYYWVFHFSLVPYIYICKSQLKYVVLNS